MRNLLCFGGILFLFAGLQSCTGTTAHPGAGNDLAVPDSLKKETAAADPFDKTLHYSWLAERDTVNTLAKRIPVPEGFVRVKTAPGTYQSWLRNLPLLENGVPVKLYNGSLKGNQDVHVAVINIDVGKRDLQQCADAVMRLRAEYLYSISVLESIRFKYTSGDRIDFTRWSKGERPKVAGNKVVWTSGNKKGTDHANFREYMDNVFTFAGSSSLAKELLPAKVADLQAGDVFIVGGFPGHAVTVIDVAENPATGEKRFMLCQSYMPAQQIHVLKNPEADNGSPWYSLGSDNTELRTPEWTFPPNSLKRFPPIPAR
jgi:hypothetical protein